MINLIVYCYILPWIECWLAPLQEFQIKITLTLHSSAKIPHIPENLDNKMFTSIVLLKFEIIWDIFFFQVSWLKSGAVEVVSVGELVFSSDSRVTVSSLTRSCKVTLHSRNVCSNKTSFRATRTSRIGYAGFRFSFIQKQQSVAKVSLLILK